MRVVPPAVTLHYVKPFCHHRESVHLLVEAATDPQSLGLASRSRARPHTEMSDAFHLYAGASGQLDATTLALALRGLGFTPTDAECRKAGESCKGRRCDPRGVGWHRGSVTVVVVPLSLEPCDNAILPADHAPLTGSRQRCVPGQDDQHLGKSYSAVGRRQRGADGGIPVGPSPDAQEVEGLPAAMSPGSYATLSTVSGSSAAPAQHCGLTINLALLPPRPGSPLVTACLISRATARSLPRSLCSTARFSARCSPRRRAMIS